MQPRVSADSDPLARPRAALKAGRSEEALHLLQAEIARRPDDSEAHLLLSHAAYDRGAVPTCVAHLSRALDLAPDNPRLQMLAAARYRALGETERALAAYDAAARLAPGDIAPRADKAHYLQTLGRFDEADRLFKRLIGKHPDRPALYRMVSAQRSFAKGDPMLRKMHALWTNPRLNDHGRMDLGFALAKAMDDTGRTDRTFAFLREANAAQRRLAPYDPRERAESLAATLAAQDTALPPVDAAAPQPRPVFISGMPRSGTTLAERIVASHPDATAGGELGHALRLAAGRFGHGPSMTPLDRIDAPALAAWVEDYLRAVRRDTGATAGIVTDKSIQSFTIFGLIRRAMPQARLIVVHRDPRDIALSIYRNHFALGTHRYATDLADIAEAIKAFRSTVRWWTARLPAGAIHEIRYEDLVADPEPTARALLAAAGLDWDPACLDTAAAGGSVKTLSVAQARQPIHAGRREAWRRYEADMQPFLDAWGDDPWD